MRAERTPGRGLPAAGRRRSARRDGWIRVRKRYSVAWIAATIDNTWPAGAARTVERRSRRRRGAGFAIAPRPRAPRAATSAGASPPDWATARSTSAALHSPATRSESAGKGRRTSPGMPWRRPWLGPRRRPREGVVSGSIPYRPSQRPMKRPKSRGCGPGPTHIRARRPSETSTGVLFGRGRGARCPVCGNRPAGVVGSGVRRRGASSRLGRRRSGGGTEQGGRRSVRTPSFSV